MRTISITSLVLLVACAGEAPPDSRKGDAGAGADAASETVRMAGLIRDHFIPLTVLPASTVATEGVQPAATTTSSEEGEYVLSEVPVGSQLYVTASRPGYLPTQNRVAVADAEVMQDLSIVSIADVRRQYVTLGRTPVAGTAVLIANLEDRAGLPAAAIPLAQITIVDAAGAAVSALGPFAFGVAGDIDPAATTSISSRGRSRIVFLDVPPGEITLRVGFAAAPITTTATVAANGAVLLAVGGEQVAEAIPDPRFAIDIHPRLQTAANGGLGCANCHTSGGSGGVLELDGPPELVLERLRSRPGLVNVTNPSASGLLVKPLYEPGMQDHPNATFLDASDADYQLLRRWITNGAKP